MMPLAAWQELTKPQAANGPIMNGMKAGIVILILKIAVVTVTVLWIASLVALRIAWRLNNRPEPLPASVPMWQVKLASGTQAMLYLLMVVVPLIGASLGWVMNRLHCRREAVHALSAVREAGGCSGSTISISCTEPR